MSERVEFLTGLLSRRLGRDLTSEEIALLREDMSRKEAYALAQNFSAQKPKPKKKSSWSKPEPELTLDEEIEVVVNEVDGGSDEGTA